VWRVLTAELAPMSFSYLGSRGELLVILNGTRTACSPRGKLGAFWWKCGAGHAGTLAPRGFTDPRTWLISWCG